VQPTISRVQFSIRSIIDAQMVPLWEPTVAVARQLGRQWLSGG
jgi:hypothetical protein